MRRVITLFAILQLFVTATSAQNYKFQALFIYNFSKNMEWPEDKRTGDFLICVFDNNEIKTELADIASRMKVGNQKIVIKEINSVLDIGQANILYIPRSKTGKFDEIKNLIATNSTIIITDKVGIEDSDINFIDTDKNLKFELYQSNISNKKVIVSKYLESLAILK